VYQKTIQILAILNPAKPGFPPNIDDPSGGGSVILHIDLHSDIGAAFTVDCCRFIEGLIADMLTLSISGHDP